ncbi:hypothetical protein BZA77DRAFT_315132 [Pyronema omphalodes]|nr:hypothetical protein BZA77DRAFT_315132 [Pyronema omphalodes]
MIGSTTTTTRMLLITLCLLLLGTVSSCTRYSGTTPTPVSDNGASLQMDRWSPAITPPPQLPGRKHYAGLKIFERADDPTSVCGYVSGSRVSPIACPNSGLCSFNTLLTMAECCYPTTDTPDKCLHYTSCIPSSSLDACTGACQSNTNIIKCTNPTEPHCGTYIIAAFGLTFSKFGCGITPLTANAQWLYFSETQSIISGSASGSARGAIRTLTSVSMGSRSRTFSSASSKVLGGAGSTSRAGSQGNPNNNQHTTNNIGYIVGGVIGGLVVISALIIALVLIIQKEKARNAALAGGFAVDQEPKYEQPQQHVYGQQNSQYIPQQQQQFHDHEISPIDPAPQYFSGISEMQGDITGYQPPMNPVGAQYEQPQQPGQQVKYGYSGQTGTFNEMPASQPLEQQQQQQQQQIQQLQTPQGQVHEAPSTRG